MGKGAFFQEVLELGFVEDIVHDARQAGAHFRLFAVTDGLDQQVFEGAAFEMQFTQHIKDSPAKGLARLVELFEEAAVNVALARLLGHEIPEVAHLRLADAMNAPKALFNTIRIPGQIVVHHEMRALKVDAFARRIGRQQYAHLRIVQLALRVRRERLRAASSGMIERGSTGAVSKFNIIELITIAAAW